MPELGTQLMIAGFAVVAIGAMAGLASVATVLRDRGMATWKAPPCDAQSGQRRTGFQRL